MSRAEKYIEENTRNCSQLHYNSACTLRHCITPDEARKAVEIAREEVIELTWEDIEKIDGITLILDASKESRGMSNQEFYQEVLKRFKEKRNERLV